MKETFEKGFLNTYVKFPKWLAYIFSGLSLSLLICVKINFNLLVFPVLAGVIAIIFIVTYFYNKKIYGNKISIEQEKIVMFDASGKKIFSLLFEDAKFEKKNVVYNGSGLGSIRYISLIAYNKNDTPEYIFNETIEHGSYRSEKNIVFIQNPTLILEIEKIFQI